MKKTILMIFLPFIMLACVGSPLSPSPSVKDRIENQGGQIEELKNNQNAITLELGKVRQEVSFVVDKIDTMQQGLVNQSNSGIHVFQGDGALMAFFSTIIVLILIVYHYYTRSKAAENKTKNIQEKIVNLQYKHITGKTKRNLLLHDVRKIIDSFNLA